MNSIVIDIISIFDNTQYGDVNLGYIIIGNVNRDGYPDLIQVWPDGEVFKSISSISDSQGLFNNAVVTDFVGDFRDNTQYVTGDVNRDGYTDLIEVWQDGEVFKSTGWINNGQGLFNNAVVTDFVGDFRNNTQYVTGEINRDGYADLIEVWQDGGVFKSTNWINNGQGLFNKSGVADFVGDFRDNTQYGTGDVNRDGYGDLIELWQDGEVFNFTFWINNGQGSFI